MNDTAKSEGVMTQDVDKSVPAALRKWFVFHFVADMLVAIPLLVAPVAFLEAFGWQAVDPYAARIVAAALFGIGIESLLGRNADFSAFVAMLNLKVIWSGLTILGVGWSLTENAQGRPFGAWVVLGIFVAFHTLWLYWLLRLRRASR